MGSAMSNRAVLENGTCRAVSCRAVPAVSLISQASRTPVTARDSSSGWLWLLLHPSPGD